MDRKIFPLVLSLVVGMAAGFHLVALEPSVVDGSTTTAPVAPSTVLPVEAYDVVVPSDVPAVPQPVDGNTHLKVKQVEIEKSTPTVPATPVIEDKDAVVPDHPLALSDEVSTPVLVPEAVVPETTPKDVKVDIPAAPQPLVDDCSLKTGVAKDACLLHQKEASHDHTVLPSSEEGGSVVPK